ncbi:MAG TPA: PA0069 family radical SAM protein [Myxococcota bacterium]
MERRALSNPPNPFASSDREYLDGCDPGATIEVTEDYTREILAHNDSPDLGFRYSVNPYRGCMHACAYCYARPTHEYLSLGAGTDFDTRIAVKTKAPELLREAFDKKSWAGETVMFSGVTDCYQPLEASYRLTRQCLEVCAEYKNPVGVITKSALIERDIDVLQQLHKDAYVNVSLSIPFFDEDNARKIEPWVPPPSRRLRAVEALAKAGIKVGVMIAPVIPGLTDEDIPKILEAAANAGASHAGYVLLRLPGAVKQVFEERVRAAFPLRAEKILHRLRETRGGELYDPRFGKRQTGEGQYAEIIAQVFTSAAKKHNLWQRRAHDGSHEATTTFARPMRKGPQLALF